MLFDSKGRPIRRRIGFVASYECEPIERPEVALIAWKEVPVEIETPPDSDE